MDSAGVKGEWGLGWGCRLGCLVGAYSRGGEAEKTGVGISGIEGTLGIVHVVFDDRAMRLAMACVRDLG